MRGAIDAAVGYIERQILKNKTRLAKRLRTEGFPPPAPADDFEVTEEKEFQIVRTKRFAVKPMSPEEAILQMNLLDHSFSCSAAVRMTAYLSSTAGKMADTA